MEKRKKNTIQLASIDKSTQFSLPWGRKQASLQTGGRVSLGWEDWGSQEQEKVCLLFQAKGWAEHLIVPVIIMTNIYTALTLCQGLFEALSSVHSSINSLTSHEVGIFLSPFAHGTLRYREMTWCVRSHTGGVWCSVILASLVVDKDNCSGWVWFVVCKKEVRYHPLPIQTYFHNVLWDSVWVYGAWITRTWFE